MTHITPTHASENAVYGDLIELPSMPECPSCGSGFASLLGALGSRVWFRCQDCGIDYSHGQTDNLETNP